MRIDASSFSRAGDLTCVPYTLVGDKNVVIFSLFFFLRRHLILPVDRMIGVVVACSAASSLDARIIYFFGMRIYIYTVSNNNTYVCILMPPVALSYVRLVIMRPL